MKWNKKKTSSWKRCWPCNQRVGPYCCFENYWFLLLYFEPSDDVHFTVFEPHQKPDVICVSLSPEFLLLGDQRWFHDLWVHPLHGREQFKVHLSPLQQHCLLQPWRWRTGERRCRVTLLTKGCLGSRETFSLKGAEPGCPSGSVGICATPSHAHRSGGNVAYTCRWIPPFF